MKQSDLKQKIKQGSVKEISKLKVNKFLNVFKSWGGKKGEGSMLAGVISEYLKVV